MTRDNVPWHHMVQQLSSPSTGTVVTPWMNCNCCHAPHQLVPQLNLVSTDIAAVSRINWINSYPMDGTGAVATPCINWYYSCFQRQMVQQSWPLYQLIWQLPLASTGTADSPCINWYSIVSPVTYCVYSTAEQECSHDSVCQYFINHPSSEVGHVLLEIKTDIT